MPGFQPVLNHLRFARHWLAKAEDEFEQARPVEGELTLTLVEAEVRKAWAESQRSLASGSSPAPVVGRRFPVKALAAGAAVLAVVLSGYGVTRLRPAGETTIPTAGLPRPAAKALPPIAAAPAPPAAARPEAPLKPAAKPSAAPIRREPKPSSPAAALSRPTPLPRGPVVQAAELGQVEITPARTVAPPAGEVPAAREVPFPERSVAMAPASPQVERAAAEESVASQAEVPQKAEPAAAAVPAVEKHPPGAATLTEGGGAPLPLDMVELVRIAERSLTGRP